MSIRENMTLALLPKLKKAGIVDRARQDEIVSRYIRVLGVKCASPDQPIKELSGGNQQRVLLARWLATDPRVLVVDEPTRGIDIGAKSEILKLLRSLADEGLSVLMISSELEELLAAADRVTVLSDGLYVRGDLAAQGFERDGAACRHGPGQADGTALECLDQLIRTARHRREPVRQRGSTASAQLAPAQEGAKGLDVPIAGTVDYRASSLSECLSSKWK
jgi:ABC-type multidrug transport system ATPase subunit